MYKLFTYGTLQMPEVQEVIIGKVKVDTMQPAAVKDFETDFWTNPQGVQFLTAVPSQGRAIFGYVLDVDIDELIRCDIYEGEAYKRVPVKLHNGETAFMYVSADVK